MKITEVTFHNIQSDYNKERASPSVPESSYTSTLFMITFMLALLLASYVETLF